jgi:hypothetical protein
MLTSRYLQEMLTGYLLTISIETLVLVAGLSVRHSLRDRLIAGVWLTLCTYPIVWLVLPPLFSADQRGWFLLVAETFAPLAEVLLFRRAFGKPGEDAPAATRRDALTIIVANLCSFGIGEVLWSWGLLGR